MNSDMNNVETNSKIGVVIPTLNEEKSVGNSRIWVVNQDNDSVSVFDAVTHAKVAEIPVGTAPRSIAIAPDDRIWVTNKRSTDISIIDPVSLGVAQTVPMPFASQPYGLVFSPVANEAYVVLEAANNLLNSNNSGTITGFVSVADLTQSFAWVNGMTDGGGNAHPRDMWQFELIDSSTINLLRGRTGQELSYRYFVVELSIESSTGGGGN